MATNSSNSLLDALRQHRLLEARQLDELSAAPPSDPKELARELIQRGWLTPYQANQLLNGKGHELVLGSYILLQRLGEGGMGQVFKARHRNLGRVAAIKLIRKERLDNPNAIRRFQREVRSAAALSHPNIVLAYDADEIAGTHLLVMEYIEGATDLAKVVKKDGPLPIERACEYIRQAALGLQHAHERGMVHRDVKPHNLLLTSDGKLVKVLDMGLARLDQSTQEDDHSSTMTLEGAVMGTPDYIAPEQALNPHTVDIRADLYSLGCSLYFLLIGRVPFPGGTLLQKLNKHQNEQPVAVELLRPEVPPAVAQVVRKLMAKRPDDRYQTPAEVASALSAVNQALTGIAATPLANEATVALNRDAASPAAPGSGDTLRSALAYMAKRSDTVAFAPEGAAKKPKSRRWLLVSLCTSLSALLGLTILMFLKSGGGDNRPKKDKVPIADRKKKDGKLVDKAKTPPEKKDPSIDPGGTAIDLLPLIDPAKDGVQGDWKFVVADLHCGAQPFARIRIPYRPPQEYDFLVEFSRSQDRGAFEQILTGGGRQFLYAVGNSVNKYVGFELVYGQEAGGDNNATRRFKQGGWTTRGQRHTSLLKVRKTGVQAVFDRMPATELTSFTGASVHLNWDVNDPSVLGLASNACPLTVYRAQVVEISGPGTFTRPRSPADLPGLLAYWKLDEGSGTTAAASGKLGLKAKFHGGSWVEGVNGMAVKLDKAGDDLDFGSDAALNFKADAPFTFAGWFKTTAATGPVMSLRHSKDIGAAINVWLDHDGKLTATVRSTGQERLRTNRAKVTGAAVNDGRWHHFAVCRSGPSIELFLDGVSQGKDTSDHARGPITTDWRTLGADLRWARDGFANAYLPAAFDEFCVFARVLSAAEIRQLATDPWRSIPLDKELTAWQLHRSKIRAVEVTEIDNEPVLHLKNRSNYLWPKEQFGDFHLRLDFKFPAKGGEFWISWGRGGGGMFGFRVLGDGMVNTDFAQAAVRRGALERGAIVSRGPLTDRTVLAEVGLKPMGDWNQLDLVRLGSAFAVFVNGRFAGATTDLRWLKDKEEIDFPRQIFAGTLQCAGTMVRRVKIRDINALPPELLAPGPWEKLLPAKDLSKWGKADNGQADAFKFVESEAEPVLALRKVPKEAYLSWPRAMQSNHVRMDIKFPGKETSRLGFSYGRPDGKAGLSFNLRNEGGLWAAIYGPAKMVPGVLERGVILPSGKKTIDRATATLEPAGAWNRLDLVRVDDAVAIFINGRFLTAFAGLHRELDGKETEFGKAALNLFGLTGEVWIRHIQIRDVNALPPELLDPVPVLQPLKTLAPGFAHGAAFDANGAPFVPIGKLRSWDPKTFAQRPDFDLVKRADSVAFSRDGKYMAVGSDKGVVQLFGTDGKFVKELVGHVNVVSALAFSRDGKLLAAGSGLMAPPGGIPGAKAEIDETQCFVKVWRIPEGTPVPLNPGPLRKTHHTVVEFSPDGNYLAAGSWNGHARLWDLRNPSAGPRYLVATSSVYAVAFHPDGKTLLTGSRDQLLRVYDPADGKLLREHNLGVDITTLAFSPDGKIVAVGGAQGESGDQPSMRLLNAASLAPLAHLALSHEAGISNGAFSADGTRFLARGGRPATVYVWDVSAFCKPRRPG